MSVNECCLKFGVKYADIISTNRRPNVVQARKALALSLWKRGYLQDEIARKLNRTQRGVSYLISNAY